MFLRKKLSRKKLSRTFNIVRLSSGCKNCVCFRIDNFFDFQFKQKKNLTLNRFGLFFHPIERVKRLKMYDDQDLFILEGNVLYLE